jgi:hypothetical protein
MEAIPTEMVQCAKSIEAVPNAACRKGNFDHRDLRRDPEKD